jgi:hypothetical protein
MIIETMSKNEIKDVSRQSHIKGLLNVRTIPTYTEAQEQLVNRVEKYHMAALHRRWFSSSRREKEENLQ